MYIVMGGTGHVGSAVAETLLSRGQAVTIVTRDAARGAPWRARGADVAVADARDEKSLRAAFRKGRRAFLLNPPGDTTGDSDALERASIACILAALEGSNLEKVVAQSAIGARPGARIGDLSTLYALEEGLSRQPIPAAIDRAAYYMSNWAPMVDGARKTGRLPTLFPIDLKIPMAAPADLGRIAADRLQSPVEDAGVRAAEGPERYSSRDVAAAFTRALGRPVEAAAVPEDGWIAHFKARGFSEASARSYAAMTAVVANGEIPSAPDPLRGATTLDAFVGRLA